MSQRELAILEKEIEKIYCQAKKFGLDFFDMRFELCPPEIIYTFGAYGGIPTRFSHWSFGKAFHRMKTQYDYNLSRIYELVINSDPCYAFLLEGNSLIQNKLVIAHVFAHCDFFKNNIHFKDTPRDMLERMANYAERIREYEFKYGQKKVEAFLDAVLAVQEHIDPYPDMAEGNKTDKKEVRPLIQTEYDDLWKLDKKEEPDKKDEPKKKPFTPQKDLLLFIVKNSRYLEDWERDIISMLREEMLYFWPQLETKIMNEGWASLWHARILRELDLSNSETIEFAKMHSGVLQPSRTYLNPYFIGMKIFEDIEKRWNDPTEEERLKYNRKGGEGLEKIFEVREIENDVSFIRNYLTEDLVEELDLYLYQKIGSEWRIVEKDWQKVRDGIVARLTNGGFPYIVVEDGDFQKNGELYLKHRFEDLELDIPYLEKTLPHVYRLWGRRVHLETVINNKDVLFSYDGEKVVKRIL